jgi:hypothetical protein
MAATYQWSESNTVSQTVTDGITNINFGSNDSANIVTATYPIIAGQNSFEKYIRAKFSDTFTEISNMKFWKASGDLKEDEVIMAAANQVFATPVSTISSKATVEVPTSVGTALAIQSTEGDTSKITTPGYTKYIVMQTQTSSSTPAGAVNTKVFCFQYDEV